MGRAPKGCSKPDRSGFKLEHFQQTELRPVTQPFCALFPQRWDVSDKAKPARPQSLTGLAGDLEIEMGSAELRENGEVLKLQGMCGESQAGSLAQGHDRARLTQPVQLRDQSWVLYDEEAMTVLA